MPGRSILWSTGGAWNGAAAIWTPGNFFFSFFSNLLFPYLIVDALNLELYPFCLSTHEIVHRNQNNLDVLTA